MAYADGDIHIRNVWLRYQQNYGRGVGEGVPVRTES